MEIVYALQCLLHNLQCFSCLRGLSSTSEIGDINEIIFLRKKVPHLRTHEKVPTNKVNLNFLIQTYIKHFNPNFNHFAYRIPEISCLFLY